MNFTTVGDTLKVSGIIELSDRTSKLFIDEVRANLTEAQTVIEVDLSGVRYLDSCGLSTLISLHKTACSRNGSVRLLNPTDTVQQLLDITRMHRLFEIVKT